MSPRPLWCVRDDVDDAHPVGAVGADAGVAGQGHELGEDGGDGAGGGGADAQGADAGGMRRLERRPRRSARGMPRPTTVRRVRAWVMRTEVRRSRSGSSGARGRHQWRQRAWRLVAREAAVTSGTWWPREVKTVGVSRRMSQAVEAVWAAMPRLSKFSRSSSLPAGDNNPKTFLWCHKTQPQVAYYGTTHGAVVPHTASSLDESRKSSRNSG